MSNDSRNLTRKAALVVAVVAGTLLAEDYRPARAVETLIGSEASEGVLILRNGNVIQGQIQRCQNHFRVAVEEGEVSIRVSDVEFFCRDLEEAYQIKRAGLAPSDARGHVLLAQWCHKQGLLAAAVRELDDAAASDPSHPLIPVIQRRIQMSLNPPKIPEAAADPIRSGPTTDDLDRMVRGMPPGTVDKFAQTVQPLLNNYCSGATCHGAGSDQKFSLVRIPTGGRPSRRTTQRNLHAVLQWIDREDPAASLLLTRPVQPHGPPGVPVFTSRRIVQYGEIADWVRRVAQAPAPTATDWDPLLAASAVDAALPAVHTEEITPAMGDRMLGDLTGLTEEVLALEDESAAPANLSANRRPNMAPWAPPFVRPPSAVPQAPPDAAGIGPSHAPAPELRPSGPKRGGLPRSFVPADLFDPEAFNRRFRGPRPEETKPSEP